MIRPAVVAGAPYSREGYEITTVDGIEVYVSNEIEADPEGMVVDLGGWGPFRFLTLEGAA